MKPIKKPKQFKPVRPKKRHRVLVVDDEESIRLLFEGILKDQTVDSVQARTGEEALKRLETEVFDLVFLDIRLPDMNGIEILQKALRIHPKLKVVVMTGHGDTRQALTAVKLGAVEYLSKPFPIKYVQKILRLHLVGGLFETCSDALILPQTFDETLTKNWSGASILLVDDNEILLSLVSQLTAQIGCRVASVTSVRAARQILEQECFDLIITDINMPGEGGLELVRWVRDQKMLSDVVMVTGYPTIEIIVEALRLGALDFIIRPFSSIEVVIDTITRALKRHSISQKNRELTAAVKRRNFELELLYKISNAVSHTIRHDVLVNLIIESLVKILDFDLAASFLAAPDPAISVYVNCDVAPQALSSAERQVFEAFTLMAEKRYAFDEVALSTIRLERGSGHQEVPSQDAVPLQEMSEMNLKAPIFFTVPLMTGGKTIGMLLISRLQGKPFGEEDVRLVSTLANQMTNAVERVREIVSTEKGKMDVVVDNMTDGIVMISDREHEPVLNPTMQKILGLEAEMLPKVTASTILEQLKRIGLQAPMEECRQKGISLTTEIVMGEQEPKTFQCVVTPVKSQEETVGTLIVFRDVTRERELDRLKSEFVSTVSHELRTPMVGVGGIINNILLGTSGSVNDQVKEYLQMADENVKRLDRLVTDLLDFSKIDRGMLKLKRSQVNIYDLVCQVKNSLGVELANKKIKFSIRLEDQKRCLFIDGDRMNQVLTNLIFNAIKFTPEEGSIDVRIDLDKVSKKADIVIQDSGVGISADNVKKLFQKFVQIDRKEGAGGGTGLGLAISKGIVEAHRGKIWVESEVGQGSSFHVEFPAYESLEVLCRDTLTDELKCTIQRGGDDPFSLIIIELTHFKEIHSDVGDKVGRELSSRALWAAKSCIARSRDAVYEFDSGKLMVLLHDTDPRGALVVYGRIRDAMRDNNVFSMGEQWSVGLQSGIACFPQDGRTTEELLQVAENNMVKKKKILIVDDQPQILNLLSRRFKDEKRFECILASNGQEALEKVNQKLPDLIICDIMMPKMNGFEVVGRLKGNEKTKDIPIIILSAMDARETHMKSALPGDVPVVLKTGGFKRLVEMAHQCV